VYKLAGIETPELSILSDEFLDGLAGKERPNLQMGLLRRLLNDQIKSVQRTNVVQARKFSEQLDEAINRYAKRALTTAEIIAELVKLAKQMRAENTRHEQLGLSVAEAAFYDAIPLVRNAVNSQRDGGCATAARPAANAASSPVRDCQPPIARGRQRLETGAPRQATRSYARGQNRCSHARSRWRSPSRSPAPPQSRYRRAAHRRGLAHPALRG